MAFFYFCVELNEPPFSVLCTNNDYSLTDVEVKSECGDTERTKNPLSNSCCEYLRHF